MYSITTKRMLEVCFSTHPNIQYRTYFLNEKLLGGDKSMAANEMQVQKSEWRKKSWSIPDLLGGKQEYFSLVKQLVELVGVTPVSDMDVVPSLKEISTPRLWREYAPFLKGVGLVGNRAGVLQLTEIGIAFKNDLTPRHLANIMQSRFRLFGETLEYLVLESGTVQEVNSKLCESYKLNWVNCSNTRKRMDWLEVLGLIEDVGNRKWKATEDGREVLKTWHLVTPALLESFEIISKEFTITPPPSEIEVLLHNLYETPELHKKRSTYNIWVPSPNRIDNLRVITQFALERVTRAELFQFIETEFNLKTSSAESMLPFLKASGLIEEIGRNIYIATSAAKAWCETGDDLDFVRILHAHMRFVGEMVKAAEKDIMRNELYTLARGYGLNMEKTRWIAGFLLEAGLLEEPRYLHLKATPLGKCFVCELPLIDESLYKEKQEADAVDVKVDSDDAQVDQTEQIFKRLHLAAIDPMAEGKGAGVAFEEAIADIFRFMGFDAKRIGGPGDTDVIVRWKNDNGESMIGIIDGKAKSGGTVSHNDISDVAIDTHKEKNNADFVAIIGPGFSGDTIRNHARKKGFALIIDTELIEIARMSSELGLSVQELSLIFEVPEGLSRLAEIMSARQREMDIIALVVSVFGKKQEMLRGLSARDMYLLLLETDTSPSMEELLNIFEILSQKEIGMLSQIKKAPSAENIIYELKNERGTVNRLRALASAIEKGSK